MADARSDTFLPSNLLAGHSTPGVVTYLRHDSSQVKKITSDAIADKFELFSIRADLGASFLAGMVPAVGAASYLRSARHSNAYLEGAVKLSITTERANLDVHHPQVRKNLSINMFQNQKATHAVVTLMYGAQLVIGARTPLNQDHSDEHLRLDSILSQTVKVCLDSPTEEDKIRLEDDSSHKTQGMQNATTDDTTFAAFPDLPVKVATKNINRTEADLLIRNLPSRIKETDGCRGVVVAYGLWPLEYIRLILGSHCGAPSIVQPPNTLLESFFQLHEAWRAVERSIKDYDDEVVRSGGCEFCFGGSQSSGPRNQLEKALLGKFDMMARFAKIMEGIRALLLPVEELRCLIADNCSGELCPRATASFLAEAKAQLQFQNMVRSQGGRCTDYDGAQRAISAGSNIYILYVSNATKGDKESWSCNRGIVERLLRRNTGDYLVAVAECAPGGFVLSRSKVAFYRRGDVIIPDMRDVSDHADQNFARYDTNQLDESKCVVPQGRKPLRLACPGPSCDQQQICEWTCYNCRVPVEYYDKHMYCQCGRVQAKAITWQYNGSHHGQRFVGHHPPALHASLACLGAYKEMNILILGETGVGKSTFINAFYNYMHFESLDHALDHDELQYLIPSSFSVQHIDRSISASGAFVQLDVKVGHDESERDGSRGDSATQKATPHCITVGDTKYRLIDTPGVGDVRGLEADQKNLASILGTLNQYEAIHGIIILLKPNSPRLSLMFRFCVKELLTNLHRDAARNIVWGFTNTRQSNYMPGDSYKPLQKLISQHESLGLQLSPETVFCFDSESFRCLAVKKQTGVEEDNMDNFRLSWKRSVEQTERLLAHFSSIEPHAVRSTISLNRARELISQLTQPIAILSDTMQRTIDLNQGKISELCHAEVVGEALQQALYFDRVEIEMQRLDHPRTVCKHSDCVKLTDVAGVKRPLYESHCHPRCSISGVEEDVVGHANIIHCTAFSHGNTCQFCGHHWQEHMHIRYTQLETTVALVDAQVQDQIDNNASDMQLKRTAIEGLEREITNTKDELEKIRDAAIKFGYFLKTNSITPYNDAMLAYIDLMIKEEQQTLVHAASNDIDTVNNETRLKTLRDGKRQYEERIKILETQMSNSSGAQPLDQAGVEDLMQELYRLPRWGQNLRDMRNMEEWSKASGFREHEVRLRPSTTTGAFRRMWSSIARSVGNVLPDVGLARNMFLLGSGTSQASAMNHGHGENNAKPNAKRGHPQTSSTTRPEGYNTRQKRRRMQGQHGVDLTDL